jgi:hypothetical protein
MLPSPFQPHSQSLTEPGSTPHLAGLSSSLHRLMLSSLFHPEDNPSQSKLWKKLRRNPCRMQNDSPSSQGGGLSLASRSPPPRPSTFTIRPWELHLNCIPSRAVRFGYNLFRVRLQSYLRLEISKSFPWDCGECIKSEQQERVKENVTLSLLNNQSHRTPSNLSTQETTLKRA